MDCIGVTSTWTAAGVLLGFQFSTVQWRVNREREMEIKTAEFVWLPVCEWLNLLSMGCTAFGVFMLPSLNIVGHRFMSDAFAVSIVLLCGYPFAIIGHYKLYAPRRTETRVHFPLQEKLPVFTTVILSLLLIAWRLLARAQG